jgi:hypothetical protein
VVEKNARSTKVGCGYSFIYFGQSLAGTREKQERKVEDRGSENLEDLMASEDLRYAHR